MTPDKTPSDDELKAMLPTKQLARDEAPKVQVWLTQSDALVFARAVLAKWGSPVVAVEPVAWRHRMGPTDCWVDCTKEFHDWVLREPEAWKGNEVQALCLATPQPTQAQAGAVPLTPLSEQFIEMMRPLMVEPAAFEAGIRFAERHHGITHKEGGQHADRPA